MTQLVKQLTKDQEAKIDVYLKKWLKIGKRTKPTDQTKAINAVKFLYKMIDMEMPTDVRFVKSPLEANKLIHKLQGKKKSEAVEYVYPTRSVYWLAYYGFYDYILNVIFPQEKNNFKLFTQFLKHSKEFFAVYMFDTVAIISEFPTEYNLNEQGQLHNDKGASMSFSDGFKLYNLNGVSVTKEIATIKGSKITKEMLLKEQNVDIRRELLRKVPNENISKVLNSEIVDQKIVTINGKNINYELLKIDIDGNGRVRPFLKMNNPSLKGVIHIEGVGDDCLTIEDAIKFRNGLDKFALPLDLT